MLILITPIDTDANIDYHNNIDINANIDYHNWRWEGHFCPFWHKWS